MTMWHMMPTIATTAALSAPPDSGTNTPAAPLRLRQRVCVCVSSTAHCGEHRDMTMDKCKLRGVTYRM